MDRERLFALTEVPSEPTDPEELFFWQLDLISRNRQLGWPPEHLEHDVRRLAETAEELFAAWLRPQLPREEAENVVMVVLPFLSYRLMNYRRLRPGRLVPFPSAQRKKFLDVFAEQMDELSNSRALRVWMEDHVKLFCAFLESLYHKREQ
jgi:hypothetical protein